MSRNSAQIVAVIGASGSGKSVWLKQQLDAGKPDRLLVWDPQDEHEQGPAYHDLGKLAQACRKAGAGAMRAVYRPGNDLARYAPKFDAFCRLAYAWTDCVVVVDELGDVTSASWAPPGWAMILRKGRHKGLRIFGAAQRPAIIDKTFFGLATLIHCSRLNFKADIELMAGVLGVTPADVLNLKADRDKMLFEWIERNMQTGECRRGKLSFGTKVYTGARPSKKTHHGHDQDRQDFPQRQEPSRAAA